MDALQPDDPRQVGRYRLLQRLGAGGMGRVFLGQSPSGRLVAVKLIRADLADDPGFRLRFAQEVAAARRVSGIYTAPVVDADPDGPQPWLVTAYVGGPSLADAVAAQGPMPSESVLTLAAGLAEGLSAVHAAGVVHRDLKPSNVLLAGDGPHIIDFGISRAADSAWLTYAGGVMGSPGFMSPEQAEGRPVGTPADIFSLGGVLAYAATGEPPFGAGPASALLYRVVYGTAATGHVPRQLRALVECCLAKDPADRPTADELLDELGYAEPAEGWQSWQAPVAALACRPLARTEVDLPAGTAADQVIEAASKPRAGQQLIPGPRQQIPGPQQRIPGPQHRVSHALVPARAGARRAPSAAFVGIAVAAVLAIGAAAAVAVAAEIRSDPAAASVGPGHRAGPPDTGADPKAAGAAAAGKPGGSDPAAVVESYFTAINEREWKQAWRLGGEHLNPSYRDMMAGGDSSAFDAVRSIRIVGDHAIVRLRARRSDGTTQVYEFDFVIRNGVIVRGSQHLVVEG
jgi:eukaryotic-like serine/threonine-protein kinase